MFRLSVHPTTSAHSLCFKLMPLVLVACGDIGLTPYSPDYIDLDDPPANPPTASSVSEDPHETIVENNDEEDQNTPPEETNEETEESAQSNESECTYNAFPIVEHQATQDNSIVDQPLFLYQARNVDSATFDELQIISYQAAPYYGPSSPGSYSLNGTNYADCGLCVLLLANCNNMYQCDQVFFVSEGTLDINALSDSGGQFAATLFDAVFEEVTIDSSTYTTTPVPGGDSWCLEELEMSVTTLLYD